MFPVSFLLVSGITLKSALLYSFSSCCSSLNSSLILLSSISSEVSFFLIRSKIIRVRLEISIVNNHICMKFNIHFIHSFFYLNNVFKAVMNLIEVFILIDINNYLLWFFFFINLINNFRKKSWKVFLNLFNILYSFNYLLIDMSIIGLDR